MIGIIYEARPNVTFDVFSLCVKSGNATVLKGGSDAHHSNVAILSVIHQILEKHGIDKNIVQLLPPEREVIKDVLNAVDYIDLVIPRGSQNLINFVRENSKVPVVETGAGIVHTYFCEYGDKEKGQAIINTDTAYNSDLSNDSPIIKFQIIKVAIAIIITDGTNIEEILSASL